MRYNLRFTIYALAALVSLVTCHSSRAGDFTPGYTFSDVESDPNSLVTSNALWRLIGDGSLKTNAIVDRTEITVTATNDFLLIYDASTNLLRKVSLNSLLPTNSVQSWQLATGAVGVAQIGTNFLRNYHFLTNWLDGLTPGTNWTVNTSTNGPGTNVFLLLGTSVNTGTNGYPTNTVLSMAPLLSLAQSPTFTATIAQAITNTVNTNRFASAEYALAAGRIQTNHGLGVVPALFRAVLVCKTNDAGYLAGEEVDVHSFEDEDGFRTPAFAAGASATNAFVSMITASNLEVVNGTNGTGVTDVTAVRWRLKMYAAP